MESTSGWGSSRGIRVRGRRRAGWAAGRAERTVPLRVELAGFNIDSAVQAEARRHLKRIAGLPALDDPGLESLRADVAAFLALDCWTPETLAAAYARISRDPSAVDELRARARSEVNRARRSNETIVFGMGHSSVAEHAVFNFDVLGLSRLAVETLQHHRLASFTEKSQRYILLDEDWVLPSEIRGAACEGPYLSTLKAQSSFYRSAYERLLGRALELAPGGASDPVSRREIEGSAKEDARYGLSLATTVQLGMTVNARALEALIAGCRAHPLAEVRDLGDALYTAVGGLAPSLVKYTEPARYVKHARSRVADAAWEMLHHATCATGTGGEDAAPPCEAGSVRLASVTPDADLVAAGALLYSCGVGDFETCMRRARELEQSGLDALFRAHLDLLGPHDPVLREFEHIELTYDLTVSAACYAQLKRHRMATITPQEYDPSLGVTIPEAFRETGLVDPFLDLVRRTEECRGTVAMTSVPAASYILTNAHMRRVLLKVNARELIHISRLREDMHAQWDIRRVAAEMISKARERMPLTMSAAGGKDRFGAC